MIDIKRSAAAIYGLSAMRYVHPFMPGHVEPFRALAELIGNGGDDSGIDRESALKSVNDMIAQVDAALFSLGGGGALCAARYGLESVSCCLLEQPDDARAMELRDCAKAVFEQSLR